MRCQTQHDYIIRQLLEETKNLKKIRMKLRKEPHAAREPRVGHPWLRASRVIRFFSSLIPSNQRTNFCNFVTKMNKIAITVGFPADNFVCKALRALL